VAQYGDWMDYLHYQSWDSAAHMPPIGSAGSGRLPIPSNTVPADLRGLFLASVFETSPAPLGPFTSTPTPTPTTTTAATITIDCPVCLDSRPVPLSAALPCGHDVCEACLRHHIEAHIGSGQAGVCPVPCPVTLGTSESESASASESDPIKAPCPPLTDSLIRSVLGEDGYARYERLSLAAVTSSLPSLRTCPTPDCGYAVEWESWEASGPPRLDCPKCNVCACIVCGQTPYHTGQQCSGPTLAQRALAELTGAGGSAETRVQAGTGAGGGGAGRGESTSTSASSSYSSQVGATPAPASRDRHCRPTSQALPQAQVQPLSHTQPQAHTQAYEQPQAQPQPQAYEQPPGSPWAMHGSAPFPFPAPMPYMPHPAHDPSAAIAFHNMLLATTMMAGASGGGYALGGGWAGNAGEAGAGPWTPTFQEMQQGFVSQQSGGTTAAPPYPFPASMPMMMPSMPMMMPPPAQSPYGGGDAYGSGYGALRHPRSHALPDELSHSRHFGPQGPQALQQSPSTLPSSHPHSQPPPPSAPAGTLSAGPSSYPHIWGRDGLRADDGDVDAAVATFLAARRPADADWRERRERRELRLAERLSVLRSLQARWAPPPSPVRAPPLPRESVLVPNREQVAQERGGAGGGGGAGAGSGAGAGASPSVTEEGSAVLSAVSGIVICGRCGNGILHAGGCNKMMCRCGFRFCAVCGRENARCEHTPAYHGFLNPITGGVEAGGLQSDTSPS
jgi:hypothetical protein